MRHTRLALCQGGRDCRHAATLQDDSDHMSKETRQPATGNSCPITVLLAMKKEVTDHKDLLAGKRCCESKNDGIRVDKMNTYEYRPGTAFRVRMGPV